MFATQEETVVVDSCELSDAALVATYVDAIVASGKDATLDSYAITDAVFQRRVAAGKDPVWEQSRDYVQHVLRETKHHVCRHAVDGHHYQVHVAKHCSDECRVKYAKRAPTQRRDVCPSCFLELTTDGVCSIGC